MSLLFRSARGRLAVLALMTSSLWLPACAAASKSYDVMPAPPPSQPYYGGGAAPEAQAEAAPMPGATPPMVDMPSAAPRVAMESMGSDGDYEGGSSDDSGFFKGGSDEAAAKAPATPLGPPPAAVAPAARGAIGAPPPKPAPPPAAANKGTPTPANQGGGKKAEGGTEQTKPEEKPAAPLLIYTGRLGMEVAEAKLIPTTIDKIIDTAESFSGYLASRTDNSVVIRVHSKHFRDALTALEKLGEVKQRSVSAEDVSEEYHDLEVRLANLKAVQKRLQEFLAKAANINDALQVEHELERVGREIDQIEGRMRFLRARATYSTITVVLTAKVQQQVVANGPPPPPPPRAIDLPIDWLSRVGLETLMNLR